MQTLNQLLPPFLQIVAGSFLMGTPVSELSGLAKQYGGTRESYREESPQHEVALDAFAIAKTPVTNALYALFVETTGAAPPLLWQGKQPPSDLLLHPVVDVSWHDAQAFCSWLNDATRGDSAIAGTYRLPSEAEWERAARGTHGFAFPWGNAWEAERTNTRERGLGMTMPVGALPAGASPVGALDMAGNIWEWTLSLDALYPYQPQDGREDITREGRRILRGGCYANPHGYARCACRFRLQPEMHNPFLGFRLCREWKSA